MGEVLAVLTVFSIMVTVVMFLFRFTLNRYCAHINHRISLTQTTKTNEGMSSLLVCVLRLLLTSNSVNTKELPRVLKHLYRVRNLSDRIGKYVTYSWIVTGWIISTVAIIIFIDGYN